MTPTSPPEAALPVAAGFWQRELAWLLDALLLAGAAHLLLALWAALPLPFPPQLDGAALRGLLLQALALLSDPLLPPQALRALAAELLQVLLLLCGVATLAYAVLAAPYFVLQEAGARRASFGKRALGLVVVDAAGQGLSRRRAAARHLASALSWLSLNLGHALAAWTPSRRALHDRVSGTRVLAIRGPLPAWGRTLVRVQLALLLAPPLLAALLLLLALALG